MEARAHLLAHRAKALNVRADAMVVDCQQHRAVRMAQAEANIGIRRKIRFSMRSTGDLRQLFPAVTIMQRAAQQRIRAERFRRVRGTIGSHFAFRREKMRKRGSLRFIERTIEPDSIQPDIHTFRPLCAAFPAEIIEETADFLDAAELFEGLTGRRIEEATPANCVIQSKGEAEM